MVCQETTDVSERRRSEKMVMGGRLGFKARNGEWARGVLQRRKQMKSFIVILMLLASVSVAGDKKPVIPVSVNAQAELAVFKSGKPLPMSVTLTNGLSETIRFSTFAVNPNNWNGETLNISLVDVYRDEQKRNLYLARPKLKVPVTISGPGARPVKPNGTLRIMIDISKWKIQGGWTKGEYQLVFRMEGITVDEKVTLSVLSDPVQVAVQ